MQMGTLAPWHLLWGLLLKIQRNDADRYFLGGYKFNGEFRAQLPPGKVALPCPLTAERRETRAVHSSQPAHEGWTLQSVSLTAPQSPQSHSDQRSKDLEQRRNLKSTRGRTEITLSSCVRNKQEKHRGEGPYWLRLLEGLVQGRLGP